MFIKITKWLCLSLGISLLPFIASGFNVILHGKPLGGYDGVTAFWKHGELCLIAIALVATGVGDVVTSDPTRLQKRKAAVICLSLVFLLFVALCYAQIAACVDPQEAYDEHLVRHGTPWLLLCGALGGFACVLLSD